MDDQAKAKLLNEFTGTVRRAVDDYHMIEAGDKVAVGVSGGKDSMLLLRALRHLQTYYPKPFELEAITIELGFEGMDFTPVADMCRELEIPYTCLKTDIKEVVFDVRKEPNPCSLCAKMRRGALNNTIRERGISKLALGHHFDDAVETFMMSLLFEGRLSCFRPVTYMDRSGVTQIRPLVYAGEQKITNVANALELPYEDASLDVVISSRLLWTLSEPENAIREWLRVLKPGGRLIAINELEEEGIRSRSFDEPESYIGGGVSAASFSFANASTEQILDTFRKAGVSDVRVENMRGCHMVSSERENWYAFLGTKK